MTFIPDRQSATETTERLSPTVLGILCLSSIGILLLHLPGWLPMATGGLVLFLPAIVLATLLIWWKRKDQWLRQRVLLGAIGGLWGTMGYDVFRIPFHLAGLNPFAPIYAYGMWVTGQPASTVGTDACGFVYHLSNGVSFGIIYALVMTHRAWGWAVLWGLLLETLAVVTPFGAVFSLRHYSNLLVLAYIAHIFYGLPLGLCCAYPNYFLRAHALRSKTFALPLLLVLTCMVGVWFVGATHPVLGRITTGSDEIIFTNEDIAPGWRDASVGDVLRLTNNTDTAAVILVREPSSGVPLTQEFPVAADGTIEFVLKRSGIFQFGLANRELRSVFVATRNQGDYRVHPLKVEPN